MRRQWRKLTVRAGISETVEALVSRSSEQPLHEYIIICSFAEYIFATCDHFSLPLEAKYIAVELFDK
jgi:hypothetical protein